MRKKIPTYIDPKQISSGLIKFDDEKCTRCGICASICPGGSILIPPKTDNAERGLPTLTETAPGVTDCVACGDCLASCPNKAISIIRGFRVHEPYFYQKVNQAKELTYPKKY